MLQAHFTISQPLWIDELNDLPTNNDEIPHELYNEWMSIDFNLPTSYQLTEDEIHADICESIKNIEENRDNEDGRNECLHNIVPSQRKIFNSMNTLRRAVHHYSDNFDLHYKYENFITIMLQENKKQTKIDDLKKKR
ncbi:hypothetical protein TKK_0009995 [Trichogramma kaykai]